MGSIAVGYIWHDVWEQSQYSIIFIVFQPQINNHINLRFQRIGTSIVAVVVVHMAEEISFSLSKFDFLTTTNISR